MNDWPQITIVALLAFRAGGSAFNAIKRCKSGNRVAYAVGAIAGSALFLSFEIWVLKMGGFFL